MRKKSFFRITFFITLIGTLMLVSCQLQSNKNQISKLAGNFHTPKYVFLFIGDGMAMPQVMLTQKAIEQPPFRANYEHQIHSSLPDTLNMLKMPVVGQATTSAQDRYITGSAAAGTALATGSKTTTNTIGMNGNHSKNLESIAAMAHDKGMKVGIITSASIDHATPAAFYAHTDNRNNYSIISRQLPQTYFDYFAGGTIRWNELKDSNLTAYKKLLADSQYHYVADKTTFENLNNKSGKIFATIHYLDTCFTDGASLPYNIDLNTLPPDDRITLADFTRKGIEVLDNPKGFFMMVEGGKIDWATHANDAVTAIYEMIAFDNAIGQALDFYKKHPDETLIVVTGDHECGGLVLGNSATHYETYLGMLSGQKTSYQHFTDEVKSWRSNGQMTFANALEEIRQQFGLGVDNLGTQLSYEEINELEQAYTLSMTGNVESSNQQKLEYGDYDPLTITAIRILDSKAGITFASFYHTALPVEVFAVGQGSRAFYGLYDNTDIPKRIMEIANLTPEK